MNKIKDVPQRLRAWNIASDIVVNRIWTGKGICRVPEVGGEKVYDLLVEQKKAGEKL